VVEDSDELQTEEDDEQEEAQHRKSAANGAADVIAIAPHPQPASPVEPERPPSVATPPIVSQPQSRPTPVAAASSTAPSPAARPSGPMTETKLRIRTALSPERLAEFEDSLEARPEIARVASGSTQNGAIELLVTHKVDTSLLGSLLAILGLDLRLTARGEGFLEVEIAESDPVRSGA
jgi:hypothetical protein